MKPIILDCTLRDGGYYNQWDFEISTVKKYLNAMDKSNVDIVEIGFRFASQKEYLGPYAYSNEDFLNILHLSDYNLKYAVMINEKEASNYKGGIKGYIKNHFPNKAKTNISIIRIAVNQNRVASAREIAYQLKRQGFNVFLNIMQISRCNPNEIENIAKEVNSWSSVETLYFADSLGSLKAKQVETILSNLKKGWDKDIGFHGHNNCNEALKNTIIANKFGCKYLDATVLGMGRGAGNTELEKLLKYFHSNKKFLNLEKLIKSDFIKLKKEFNWGSNIYYRLAAKKDVHPTYIQEMLAKFSHDENTIITMINYLSRNNGHSYTSDSLKLFGQSKTKKNVRSKLKSYFKNKKLLFIGPGETVKKNKEMIEILIKSNSYIVISCLTENNINEKYIDYYISSNFVKNKSNIKKKKILEKKFIAPLSSLPKDNKFKKIINYEVIIKDEKFEISDYYTVLPSDKTLLYCLSVGIFSSAKMIHLAGFDGYKSEDNRQKLITSALNLFEKNFSLKKVKSITKTTYNIPVRSMYEY